MVPAGGVGQLDYMDAVYNDGKRPNTKYWPFVPRNWHLVNFCSTFFLGSFYSTSRRPLRVEFAPGNFPEKGHFPVSREILMQRWYGVGVR